MRMISIFLLLFPIVGFSQTVENIPQAVCTEECEFDAFYKVKEIEVPIYIGDENDMTVKRDIYYINLENGVQKRIAVVLDLYQTESYEMKTFRKREMIRASGENEEREVLCPEKVTPAILNQIQNKLLEEDFLPQGYEPMDELKLELKNALIQYQRTKGLPIGHLDFETLEHLNVEM